MDDDDMVLHRAVIPNTPTSGDALHMNLHKGKIASSMILNSKCSGKATLDQKSNDQKANSKLTEKWDIGN